LCNLNETYQFSKFARFLRSVRLDACQNK
jgi:hypothetical protein